MSTPQKLLSLFFIALLASAAEQPAATAGDASVPALAKIIGADELLRKCADAQCTQLRPETATVQQLLIRQQIGEKVMAASLDLDGVLAEISNEHAQLLELQSVLQARRDRAANLITTGNLIIGTGLGILVNALQFRDSTAILGDGIGVGSGAASTILSLIGIRIQNGPQRAVGRSPNMLAVPLGKEPVLHSEYPPTVLAYLNSVPEGEAASQGTRLEQLRKEWQKAGRLGAGEGARTQKKIELLTSSLDAGRKLSISDISDRAFMLQDLAGRIALMQRDLADLVRSLQQPSQ